MRIRKSFLIVCLVLVSLVGDAQISLPDSMLTITKSYVYNISSPDTAQAILRTIRERQTEPAWRIDFAEGDLNYNMRRYLKGGTMFGSVYGGGRLASVGYGLYLVDEEVGGEKPYGVMRPDNVDDKGNSVEGFKRGYITVNINGGTIGKEFESETEGAEHSGNVFGGSMGRLTKLDGTAFSQDHWTLLATAKQATVNIKGGIIKRSVYGGSEMGTVTTNTDVTISGGTIGTSGKTDFEYGNVFGGGKGLDTQVLAGIVKGNTSVTVENGTNTSPTIYHNVYGGGAYGSVGTFTISEDFRTFTWGDPYNETGVSNVTIKGGTIGTGVAMSADGTFANGNVFGGGRGIANTFWCEKGIAYKAKVNISNGTVKGNVYGGGEVGRVESDALVTIGDGTGTPVIEGSVFGAGAGVETHGYSALVRGNTTVTVLGDAKVGHSVYGGGQIAAVGKYSLVDQAYLDSHPETELEIGMPYSLVDENLGICNVTVKGNTVIGNGGTGHVYGAGMGLVPRDYTYADNAHRPKRMMSFNSSLYNDTNKDYWEYADTEKKYVWEYFPNRDKYLTFVETLGLATRTIVDIDGSAQVNGSVYGGSESGFVQHNTSVTIQGSSTIGVNGKTDTDGNVLGGGLGIKGNLTAGRVSGNSTVTIKNGTMKGSVFGGGENGIVKCGVNVNVLGGSIAKDVYGGGALANTNTAMWDATNSKLYDYVEVSDLIPGSSPVTGYYTSKSADALITDKEAKAASGVKYYAIYKTTVNLLGGSINDAYGGGLGQNELKTGETVTTPGIEAIVYGDVNLNLNGLETADYVSDIHNAVVTDVDNDGKYYRATDGCIVTGNVFGCNNVNGTPKGHAKVHVFKTVPKPGQAADGYDVDHVFGGGNNADYIPAVSDTKQSTEVIIEGCDLTSIYQVYGGGNAAASPGTSVLVKGTKIIYEVFGGGNGESTETFENPGANVGYLTGTATAYGAEQGGKSQVQLMAGNVNYVYGGSNSNGNIRGGSSVTNVTNEHSAGCCDKMKVQEIYAGGKNADMKGGAKIVMGCTESDDWVEEVYAGAKNANVGGDVSLTLTSGKFGRVFGGNKESGILDGSITVNIEENAKCGVPLIIGELYGGGNKAAYSIYGYNADGTVKTSGEKLHASPVVNVRAFTSIGNIFGGGYGEKAVMYGSPTININVVNINRTTGSTISTEITKTFEEGTDNEYSVKIPTHDDPNIGAINNVFGGGNAAKIYGDTNVNIGTEAKQKLVVIKDSGDPDYESDGVTPKTQEMDVVGADIRGNVYGGGNKAEVTGNTNVVIGKQSATSVTP